MLNKKASLEISIQAIVIVVLAMTILGLGLAFVKGMFGGITDLSKTTFDKIADQLQRDLTATDQKLIFSQTKITLARGKSELYGWGIRNEGDTKLNYYALFNAIRCPDDVVCEGTALLNNEQNINTDWFTFRYDPVGGELPYSVEAGSQQIERVDLRIPRDTKTGLYLISLQVYDDSDELWASTDIFVTVT